MSELLGPRQMELRERASKVAREAAEASSTPDRPRYVFGSVGPGTKLPTLGQVAVDELCGGLQEQIRGLVEALEQGPDDLKIPRRGIDN